MPRESFPNRTPDGEEPDGSEPLSARDEHESVGRVPGDDPQGLEQGLFLCLPAGSLDPDQFAQCGPAADMPPDPLLATIIDTVTGADGRGLAGLSDDQLVGVIAAVRRLESRAAWYLLSAVGEFTARHTGAGCVAEFAADQLAHELHLTLASAAAQMDYARAVAGRLPQTFAALAAGRLHPVHVRIIEDETAVLSAADAARADAVLAGVAGSLTFGKLRSAAHRLVLELDPESAQRRKQAAKQDAHVRRFREESGNAGMVARELPPDEVLASWQHVEQRALDLRAAGVPGTLQELRVRGYLDLLQERDSRLAPAGAGDTGGPGGPPDDGTGASGNGGSSPGGPGRGPAGRPGGPGGSGRARRPGADSGPSFAALVNITVPWSALAGRPGALAEVAGFGLVDAADARDLAAAAARDPRTRWCVTALHPDGTAAAHGCAAGRHPPPGPGPGPQDLLGRLRIRLAPIARGACGHASAEPGYRPSRRLQHLVRTRNARCTAPGCGRPAGRCD
ncbi:MAG TPA: DUF222 domain-containing protein, partial [Streptosporangiaceae bacterium]|nr:DUF222 domain-containing protein [Streptosporangiaceae bacterium]